MKGQTAIEYLMTYGWAILIILIVAGVLAYYGIFAPSGFLGPTQKGWTQIYVMQPWDLDASGNLKMQLENRVGQDIIIHNVSAVMGNAAPTIACTETGWSYDTDTITAGTKYPTSGLLTLDCASSIGTGNSGSSYTINVKVEYYVGGISGTLLAQTGTLGGTRS